MSELRVNSITDEEGTGAPEFPNGVEITSGNISNTDITMSNPLQFSTGSAAAPSLTFAGDTNTGLFRPAANTLAAVTDGSERMRITSAGNVGIETSSPSQRLSVNGSLSVGRIFGSNISYQQQTVSSGSNADFNLGFGTTGTKMAVIECRNTANFNFNRTRMVLFNARLNIFGGGNQVIGIADALGDTGTGGEITGFGVGLVEISGTKFLRVTPSTRQGTGNITVSVTLLGGA